MDLSCPVNTSSRDALLTEYNGSIKPDIYLCHQECDQAERQAIRASGLAHAVFDNYGAMNLLPKSLEHVLIYASTDHERAHLHDEVNRCALPLWRPSKRQKWTADVVVSLSRSYIRIHRLLLTQVVNVISAYVCSYFLGDHDEQ